MHPCALCRPQEERRLRTAYENAEGSEREKFALFSAAVRESHEKERTRAERTKNWSIIGSVLGALIGVMGSTYINRVRLQVSYLIPQRRNVFGAKGFCDLSMFRQEFDYYHSIVRLIISPLSHPN